MKNIRTILLAMALTTATGSMAQSDLQQQFANPPQEARPRVWWHWMNGNISKYGIKKDLEWMHRAGIAGIHVFDAGLNTPQIVPHRITYMTPEWKDCFRYAVHIADSLGMTMAIPSSPGWSNTGGPWVTPHDAMKKITWRAVRVKGGKKLTVNLPGIYTTTGHFQNVENTNSPETFSQQIGVVAVRMPDTDIDIASLNPTITVSKGEPTVAQLTDGDYSKGTRVEPDAEGNIWAQYTFEKPVTIKALSLSDGNNRSTWNSWSAPLYYRLETSNDGKTFTKVCDIPQSGTFQQTIDLPPTTARCFRVVCQLPQKDKQGEYVNLMEYNLYTTSRINFAEEKAGFTSFGDLDQYPSRPDSDVSAAGDVVVLTDKVDADGRLTWNAPRGNWVIYRFGTSLFGSRNGPASPEATGLEVDKMDREAVHKYIEHYIDLYRDASGGNIGKRGIQYLLIDSYEPGKATWTLQMPAQFERRRGYSIYPWLPVLTGVIVGSVEQSEQFLYDYRQTIGELMDESLYAEVADAAHRHGMKIYIESHENGRQMLADGISVKAKGDIPMGAMWAEKRADLSMYECDLRETSSTAHIYGKKYVAGESFTADGRHEMCYTFYPGNLKPIADYMMSCGLNRFIIHESAHQPVDDRKPGLALAIYGQWFNRHETWAEQARSWTDYLGRSSYMMQQGKYVADIAYYYGGDNSVNGRFAHNHPAIPRGYNFDYVNPGALMDVFGYDGQKLTTKAGMSYRLLVIDRQVTRMTVDELKAIARLAKAGAPICGKRPTIQPNLKGDDAEWHRLVAEIWDSNRANVMENLSMEEALAKTGVAADFSFVAADKDKATPDSIRWMHRRTADSEIYWVANAIDQPKRITASFNVTGKKPMLWNAENASIKPVGYTMADGRTSIDLDLDPYGALFIVFTEPTDEKHLAISHAEEQEVMTLDNDWHVYFGGVQDTPESIEMPTLRSLTESDDAQIRYFSGTAVYTRDFDVKGYNKRATYRLDLGGVGCMAEVYLNGQMLGTLWKAPYAIDITPALKKKGNKLEVRVTNLWANRVIGDKQPDKKKRYAWASYNNAFRASSKPLPAGLLGGVRLLCTPAGK